MSVSYRGSKPVMCIQELGPFGYILLLVSLKSSLCSPCVFVKILRPCLIFFFFFHSISITRHSSLLTHYSKILCLFGTITHFPLLNIFHTICGLQTCHPVQFFLFLFFFFFFSTQTHRT